MELGSRDINKTTHWFVPLAELDAEEGSKLRRADIKPSEADNDLVNEGDSFLVTLESLLIVEKHDRRSDNDLLVRSRLKYGNEPLTEAINFFANDVLPGRVQNNLLSEYVYSREEYSEADRVHLEVEVMELKGDISLDQEIMGGLKAIKDNFGIVFSSFLPFGDVAFEVMDRLNTVRGERQRIFVSNLNLYGEGGEGESRLRYGAYVFFKEPVDGSKYRLHKLQVEHLTPKDSATPVPHDYVVVKIVPVLIQVGSDEELALNNQQLAAVLKPTNGQADSVSRKGHLDFVQSFMRDAKKLRDLDVFYGLQKLKDSQESLTEIQVEKYQKLLQELREYIRL